MLTELSVGAANGVLMLTEGRCWQRQPALYHCVDTSSQ